MARPKQHGIKRVVRKDANGSIVRHDYYYNKGDERIALGSDFEVATKRAAELNGEIAPVPPPTSMFDGLAADYLASDSFRRLAPKSQTLNRLYINKLLRTNRFGGVPVVGITRPVVIAFREKLSKEIVAAPKRKVGDKKPWLLKGQEGPMTPDIAKHLVNKLCRVLQHGVDLGVLDVNPAIRVKANFGVSPRKSVWEPEQITCLLNAVPDKLKVASALLFYSAQRSADVMSMTWDQAVEKGSQMWLSLIQKKTGERILVPAHRELAAVLRGVTDKSGLMVPSPRYGIAWQYRNFCRAWDVAMNEAGMANVGLQRRDLRRTAMVRMAEAGATDAQIAAVSGHTIEQTRRILDTYIPRRGEIAAGAIAAWERMNDVQDAQARRVVTA